MMLANYGQGQFCLVATKEGILTLDDVCKLLDNHDQYRGYFVIHSSQANPEFEAYLESRGWHLLNISTQSCRAMDKYLTPDQRQLAAPHLQALLMLMFISGNTDPTQNVGCINHGGEYLFVAHGRSLDRAPSEARPVLLVCGQQPCRCSPRRAEADRQIRKLADRHLLRVVKTRCIGLCSPKGAAMLVRPNNANITYIDDLYFSPLDQLEKTLTEN